MTGEGWPRRLHVMVPPHTQRYAVGDRLPVEDYLLRLREHLAAAEDLGADGVLIYNFASALDPWLVAWDVLAASRTAVPIIGILPYQETAESVLRRLDGLRYRFGRTPYLNVVAGASQTQRRAAGYDGDRLRARKELAVYVEALRDEPTRIYTPGSSSATEVPVDCDATLVLAKPRQALRDEAATQPSALAMLVGIVARESSQSAWAEARARFTGDRRSRLAVRMQRADNASSQHRLNFDLADQGELHDECLWYGSGTTGVDAPKLVGSYAEVGEALLRYRACGVEEVVVDLPADVEDYRHVAALLRQLSS